MNGSWFWWGGGDPATFQKVWRQMFDYFTTTRKLNNLIWVYSPNHGTRTAAYYAGDHYVDLVGLDAYTDNVDPQHIHGYDEVAALPKPFGFTEFGPHGPSNPPGDYDYRRFIAGIKQYFPRACFFMSWNDRWSIGGNNDGKELMNDPWIISRGDLPARLFTVRP
jgi:mannan endo-1,4-beta-mannosidase